MSEVDKTLLLTTPPRQTPTIASAAMPSGGRANTSQPVQCRKGIGIQSRKKVATPIQAVMVLACRRKSAGFASSSLNCCCRS